MRNELDGDDKDISVWRLLTFGATKAQIQGFVMISWRAVLMFHVFWVCGWLSVLGLNPPFASAKDAGVLEQQLMALKQASELSTKLNLVREIRLQTDVMCSQTDARAAAVIRTTIDRLREDYSTITKSTYPEPNCGGN